MNLVDIISLLIIIAFLIWGTKKGFILEVSEIAGLIIAFILAMYLPLRLNIGAWRYLVSFLLYFIVISVGFSILSTIVNKTPLVLIDKALGSFIGALKGFIVVLIILLIISVVPGTNNYRTLNRSSFYRTTLRIKPLIKSFLQRKMEQIKPNPDIVPPSYNSEEKSPV